MVKILIKNLFTYFLTSKKIKTNTMLNNKKIIEKRLGLKNKTINIEENTKKGIRASDLLIFVFFDVKTFKP